MTHGKKIESQQFISTFFGFVIIASVRGNVKIKIFTKKKKNYKKKDSDE